MVAKECSSFNSLVELGRYRAENSGDKVAYHMLKDGSFISRAYTYKDVDGYARSIAAELQNRNLEGERALLLFHTGLDFVIAFMACLYAGVIAVPVHFPGRKNKDWENLDKIVGDARVAILMSDSKHTDFISKYKNGYDGFNSADYLEIDGVDIGLANNWRDPKVGRDALAFLQYTSGSTGIPKGVMVTHGNLLHNEELMKVAYQHSSETVIVSWLPLYHDMGLIGNVLHTLYLGSTCYLMTPVAFLQQPFRWLKALSDYKAHSCFAPNFAYQLCLKRITPEQRDSLDLSHWKMALNGAEPVRADTLDRFSQFFGPCGFNAKTAYPAYGLAEATLFVSGSAMDEEPHIVSLSSSALKDHKVIVDESSDGTQRMVCSGVLNTEQDIVIVNPDTFDACADDEVGEIWIHGPSVAQGYWERADATEETFRAKIKGDVKATHYLRTGDLGFVQRNRLFIAGRIKDMVIVNGANYYPQDIEKSIQEGHEALKEGSGAVFGVVHEENEQLVIVQEVERTHLKKINVEDVFSYIRNTVSQEFQSTVAAIVLIKPMTLPLTSSGKIQRRKSKQMMFDNTLNEIARWSTLDQAKSNVNTQVSNDNRLSVDASRQRASELIVWLKEFSSRAINSRLIDERRTVPPHILMNFATQGLLGMCVDSDFSGQGMQHRDFLDVVRHMGAMDPNLALLVALHNVLGIRPIMNYGSKAIKDKFLAPLAKGTILGAFALSEPEAGSNPHAIASSAVPSAEGGWVVNGEKCWIGNAGWAGVINCFVKVFDEKGKNLGITAFAVEVERSGLIVGDELPTMGVRGMVQNRVYFRDMRVTEKDVLGGIGQGMAVAQDAMKHGRLIIAAMGLGVMQRSAQLTSFYAAKRNVADGLLLDNPLIQQRLTDMHAGSFAAQCMINGMAEILDLDAGRNPDIIPMEVYASVKSFGSEYCVKAVDQLIQLLGGRGYTDNNIAPRLLRDTRIFRIFEGPTEVLNGFLGASFTHKSTALKRFITENLQLSNIYSEMTEHANQLDKSIHELKTEHGDCRITDRAVRWIKYAKGELAGLFIVKAFLLHARAKNAVHSPEDINLALSWLQKEIRLSLFNSQQAIHDSYHWSDGKDLNKAFNTLNDSIGCFGQSSTELEIKVDSWLRPRADATILSPDTTLVNTAEREPFNAAVHTAGISSLIAEATNQENTHHAEDFETFIIEWLKREVTHFSGDISAQTQFSELGLDSVLSVELAFALQEKAGFEIDSTVVWSYPTVHALARYVVDNVNPVGEQNDVPVEDAKNNNSSENVQVNIAGKRSVIDELMDELDI
ncbi:AMP-binding protein [Teredinibacter purpureus]|uniref:AMP-binding protein n=1 Tax=Teredinibacter purpureus TaxID=2731756 RepID=UPI0006961ABF|nr:AMP-binding protein [Teredinibacter purpureus]